jgi:hypothetical protein
MRKISGRAMSGLYHKLPKIWEVLQDWRSRSRKTSDPIEGLGAVYDKRKWLESYYGKHP